MTQHVTQAFSTSVITRTASMVMVHSRLSSFYQFSCAHSLTLKALHVRHLLPMSIFSGERRCPCLQCVFKGLGIYNHSLCDDWRLSIIIEIDDRDRKSTRLN